MTSEVKECQGLSRVVTGDTGVNGLIIIINNNVILSLIYNHLSVFFSMTNNSKHHYTNFLNLALSQKVFL